MYRYFIGVNTDLGLNRLFSFDSESPIEESTLLASFCATLLKGGVVTLSLPDAEYPQLGVDWDHVCSFRGQEVEWPKQFVAVSRAFEGVGPDEVLVLALSEKGVAEYDHLLLVMPRGSNLAQDRGWPDPKIICDKDVNQWQAFDAFRSRGRTAPLPKNTRQWDIATQKWVSVTELVYGDGLDWY